MKNTNRIVVIFLTVFFAISLTGIAFSLDKTRNSKKSLLKMKGKTTRTIRGKAGQVNSGALHKRNKLTEKPQSNWKGIESEIESNMETQGDLNQIQMLELQNSMQQQNRSSNTISNINKMRHDTQKNIINNMRK